MSDDKDNLTLLPKLKTSEMEKALITLKADLPAYEEFQMINAKLTKRKYDLLVKEGFNEVQALELSKVL